MVSSLLRPRGHSYSQAHLPKAPREPTAEVPMLRCPSLHLSFAELELAMNAGNLSPSRRQLIKRKRLTVRCPQLQISAPGTEAEKPRVGLFFTVSPGCGNRVKRQWQCFPRQHPRCYFTSPRPAKRSDRRRGTRRPSGKETRASPSSAPPVSTSTQSERTAALTLQPDVHVSNSGKAAWVLAPQTRTAAHRTPVTPRRTRL